MNPRAATVFAVVLVCAGAGSATKKEEVVLPFWGGEGVRVGGNIVEVIEDHPCGGPIALARVSRIPDGKGQLSPEEVVEFSESGAVTTHWNMQIDEDVLAVRGSEIVVPGPYSEHEPESWLFISPNGQFHRSAVTGPLPRRVNRSCPVLPIFGDSAYVRCFTFEDLKTHRPRDVAYQVPCT